MRSKDAVLLVNLGTPEQPTPAGVRKFLREFLSDRRVVEVPRPIWLFILYAIILPFRPRKVARAYQSIWTKDGSPLKVCTENLGAKLQCELTQQQGEAAPLVRCAYSYGNPNIATQVEQLRELGVERILLLPLYPQYSATTTGSVYDQYAEIIRTHRDIPDIRIQKSYCQREDYVAALVQSIRRHWQDAGQAQKLLFSFHGIPQRNVDLGDPYQAQCVKTAEDVVAVLALERHQWEISFQSRLGRAQWLLPYTDKLLAAWGRESVASVNVICPAFAIDCLETLEEINIENRHVFLEAGGQSYSYIPCLNDADEHVFLLSNIVLENFA